MANAEKVGPLLATMLLVLTLQAVNAVACAEIDTTSTAVSVHDGDTFTIATGDKVRLADLNAPELGEEGSYEARDYLTSLVWQKTVYLDVDDKYRTDSYGRLVCVVYVDYNSSHYLNVNKALIDGGYAEAKNYDNEFAPNSFSLYIPKGLNDQPVVDVIQLVFGMVMTFAVFAVILILVFLRRGACTS